MFWAAWTKAYFGFLRSAEFTVQSLNKFDPDVHLTVKDISLESANAQSCLKVRIKASETDPFRQGCDVFIGRRSLSMCAVTAFLQHLTLRGNRPVTLFLLANGQPLRWQLVRFCKPQGSLVVTLVTATALGWLLVH